MHNLINYVTYNDTNFDFEETGSNDSLFLVNKTTGEHTLVTFSIDGGYAVNDEHYDTEEDLVASL